MSSGQRFYGNTKRRYNDGQRRQFYQTTVRHYSTDYESHPSTVISGVVRADEKPEKFVKREKLDRSTGKNRQIIFYEVYVWY